MNQDTTTQAMVEVALALAMAFFALMVLAMLSMSVQGSENNNSPDIVVTEQISPVAPDSTPSDSNEDPVVLFYFQSQFFDDQGNVLTAQRIATHPAKVLAVAESMNMKEIFSVQQRINRPDLSITLMNNEWKTFLESQL